MLEFVKKRTKNYIKSIWPPYRRERLLEDQLTVALVEVFLARSADVSNIRLPSHFLKLCFELFSATRVGLKRVKWCDSSDQIGFKRFDRFVQQLERSMPGYDTAAAREILDFANNLSGSYAEKPGSGLDITQHFLISSSFGFKGKLLFNIVRFMRPSSCIEIGTAYGMSAMFILQSLEKLDQNGKLWTVESADIQFAKSSPLLTDRFGAAVNCLHGLSKQRLPDVIAECDAIDLYFHDGGHDYDNIVENFEQVKPSIKKGGVVVIDDIRWWDRRLQADNPRCYEAWKYILNDARVSCAIEVNNDTGIALIE